MCVCVCVCEWLTLCVSVFMVVLHRQYEVWGEKGAGGRAIARAVEALRGAGLTGGTEGQTTRGEEGGEEGEGHTTGREGRGGEGRVMDDIATGNQHTSSLSPLLSISTIRAPVLRAMPYTYVQQIWSTDKHHKITIQLSRQLKVYSSTAALCAQYNASVVYGVLYTVSH